MTKTQQEKEKLYSDMIDFIENVLFLRTRTGLELPIKLNKIQKELIKDLIFRDLKNFQIVSSSRIKKRYRI
jgi:hypothetical protein